MLLAVVAVAAFAVAGGALALPYLPSTARSPGVSPADRAGWVNRLFGLAGQADEAGDVAVASAARALIAALVAEKELPKKGR
jgi:hypothetical protein